MQYNRDVRTQKTKTKNGTNANLITIVSLLVIIGMALASESLPSGALNKNQDNFQGTPTPVYIAPVDSGSMQHINNIEIVEDDYQQSIADMLERSSQIQGETSNVALTKLVYKPALLSNYSLPAAQNMIQEHKNKILEYFLTVGGDDAKQGIVEETGWFLKAINEPESPNGPIALEVYKNMVYGLDLAARKDLSKESSRWIFASTATLKLMDAEANGFPQITIQTKDGFVGTPDQIAERLLNDASLYQKKIEEHQRAMELALQQQKEAEKSSKATETAKGTLQKEQPAPIMEPTAVIAQSGEEKPQASQSEPNPNPNPETSTTNNTSNPTNQNAQKSSIMAMLPELDQMAIGISPAEVILDAKIIWDYLVLQKIIPFDQTLYILDTRLLGYIKVFPLKIYAHQLLVGSSDMTLQESKNYGGFWNYMDSIGITEAMYGKDMSGEEWFSVWTISLLPEPPIGKNSYIQGKSVRNLLYQGIDILEKAKKE